MGHDICKETLMLRFLKYFIYLFIFCLFELHEWSSIYFHCIGEKEKADVTYPKTV